MRSIWKGAISFGLVTIPVKLYSATEEKNVSFHQVHREDGGRIRYKRVCSLDGEEVSYGDIAKGYELSSGETVILTDEDFADLPLSTSRTIDVLQFVPLEEVDPIYFAKSYYLEPERTGTKPYVLLRDALEQSDKVAVVKVALRQREQLATLRVRDGVFVLETMLWPDEIRTPEFAFLEEDVEVRPQELTMAGSLIDSLTAEFDPSQYNDEYREALEAVIAAKVEGQEVVQPAAEQPQGGAVLDLMAALRASVEAAKGSRPERRAVRRQRRTVGTGPEEGLLAAQEVGRDRRRRPARRPRARRPPSATKRARALKGGAPQAQERRLAASSTPHQRQPDADVTVRDPRRCPPLSPRVRRADRLCRVGVAGSAGPDSWLRVDLHENADEVAVRGALADALRRGRRRPGRSRGGRQGWDGGCQGGPTAPGARPARAHLRHLRRVGRGDRRPRRPARARQRPVGALGAEDAEAGTDTAVATALLLALEELTEDAVIGSVEQISFPDGEGRRARGCASTSTAPRCWRRRACRCRHRPQALARAVLAAVEPHLPLGRTAVRASALASV